jgi:hypothetical protein
MSPLMRTNCPSRWNQFRRGNVEPRPKSPGYSYELIITHSSPATGISSLRAMAEAYFLHAIAPRRKLCYATHAPSDDLKWGAYGPLLVAEFPEAFKLTLRFGNHVS